MAEFLCMEFRMEKNIAYLAFCISEMEIDHCMENFTM